MSSPPTGASSAVTECDDGIDNDSDGLADFPDDPGCTSIADSSEQDAGLPCDDGIDNDGDGGIDFVLGFAVTSSDRGCIGPGDPDERSPDLPCDDGIDNDGDGLTDFPDDCPTPRWPSESNLGLGSACTDGIDNDGDGEIDSNDPGCAAGAAFDPFESTLITTTGGVISGYLCETTSADCQSDANFSVTSAVVGTGRMVGPGGKSSYTVDIEIPQITFEGSHAGVARVELTDITMDGFYLGPFLHGPLHLVTAGSSFNGTIEHFDSGGARVAGPASFSVFMDDLSNIGQSSQIPFQDASISYCTSTAAETGECTLFLDSLGPATPSTLDVAGTPHRVLLKFASIALSGTCGNGVIDPGEVCDDGNEVSGDCCSSFCDVASPIGTLCDDGNTCTQVDACDGTGLCQGASPLVCDDANACTDDGCDPVAGCEFMDNSAPCDDALFCNGSDTCTGGACSIHAGDPCPGADGDGSCAESCDEVAGACTGADPNGSSCTDANACTELDSCVSGICEPGESLACDDADVCTADSCDELTGCAHDPIPGCPPMADVPTGGNALWLLTIVAVIGVATHRLVVR